MPVHLCRATFAACASNSIFSMTFTITIEPSGRSFTAEPDEAMLAAGIRQGIGLPYGCKDGACGSCKCKMVSGSVVHGPHQTKALSAEEEAAGFVLTCCGVAQSDVVLESRQVTEAGAFPIKKMPVRVSALERASPDVMVMRLQLPASDTFQYHAGQYVEFLLRDGERRSYSMANAPHTQAAAPQMELHLRHMPGGKFTDHVFGAMKEKDILRIEGPYGSFYLREDSAKPMVLLASGTGFAPIKALIEHMQFKGIKRPATLYWGGRRPADLYQQAWIEAQSGRDAQPALCAGGLGRPARRRLDRPHRLRAPRGAARRSRSVGSSGLRLRRADRDRIGPHRLQRAGRSATRRSFSPTRSPAQPTRPDAKPLPHHPHPQETP